MNFGYSELCLVGRLTSAPRTGIIPGRDGAKDIEVVNLSIAVTTDGGYQEVTMKNGQKTLANVTATDYHDVALFSAEHKAVGQALVAGQEVYITPRAIKGGKPYERDGKTFYTTQIRVSQIVPGALPKNSHTQAAAPASAKAAPAAVAAGVDDELNF
jgi:single-stranded DNA-binding protein